MNVPAQRARLSDGRWHFQHGPIDLVIHLDAEPELAAHRIEHAWQRFEKVLPELCAELTLLRVSGARPDEFCSPIARQMAAACLAHHQRFGLYVTPMAAVAGSVAQAVLACLCAPGVRRASVNNGGDIALFLGDGARYSVGVIADPLCLAADPHSGRVLPQLPGHSAEFEIDATSGIRGIATSGWRGRSLSLGIADAVTVLAADAPAADAAATLIGNAVNVDFAGIVRLPANTVRDDSDLHDRPVTRAVPMLPRRLVDEALASGARFARDVVAAGLAHTVFLSLQGEHRVAGPAAGLANRLPAGQRQSVQRKQRAVPTATEN